MINQVKYKIIDNVIYTPEFDGTPDPKGVGHHYYTQMKHHKSRIAQVDGYTKEEDTFEALLQRSVRTALTLIDEGIKPGDHISLCTRNHLNSAVPHIASYFTGSIMGAIDPTMSVEECAFLLKQTLPKMIFVGPSKVALIEKVIERIGTTTKIVVFGKTTEHTPFSKFIRPHKKENEFMPREPKNLNELALIVFSSGSTGNPKGICFSHLNMLCVSKKLTTDVPSQVLYSISNPYWSVFPFYVHLSIEFGFKRVVYTTYNYKDLWALFYQPIDMAFLNPIQALQMVRSKKPEEADLRNLKQLLIAGNPITQKQLDELTSALPHTLVLQGYSQSEIFNSLVGFEVPPADIELIKKNVYSVGSVLEGFSYKIVDPETEKVLGPNEVGELRIKSPCQFIGYFNQDSSECFDSDGWLKTGDLLYYNEDLLFYYVDRIKESFKFHHHHISPVTIEKVILSLDSIETAVVVGIPHPTECNHPMAVVKLKQNAKEISAEEIVNFVEKNLEDKKRLRGGVKFVNEFPMTVTGKINRFKLKKMILNNEI